MDVEGGKYEIIHSLSDTILRRFRILVIELHHLNQLKHTALCSYMKNAFAKLLQNFRVCHAKENFAAGKFRIEGKSFEGPPLDMLFLKAIFLECNFTGLNI